MLILARKIGEGILIGGNVIVKVQKIEGSRVYLGIEAPREIDVKRTELPPHDKNKGGSDGADSAS